MDKFVCYSYCIRSAYNSTAGSDEFNEPTHTFVLAGNAMTDANGVCHIPLYNEGQRDPRFYPYPQRPVEVNNRHVAFSRVLSVTATETEMPPPLGLLPASMTCVVEMKPVTLSPGTDEVVVIRDISGEGPDKVYSGTTETPPALYHPTLIFRSWLLNGQPAASRGFSWRLEGELLVMWQTLAGR